MLIFSSLLFPLSVPMFQFNFSALAAAVALLVNHVWSGSGFDLDGKVLVLTRDTFASALDQNPLMMVEFYAPCKSDLHEYSGMLMVDGCDAHGGGCVHGIGV
jgi:hypothetical protein